MYQLIKRDALKAKLDGGAAFYLVEALPQRHFDVAHLPGAIHLPHDQVDVLAAQRLPDRHREVVVYCANLACNNSRIAATRLDQLGYTVFAYEDGKQDWIEAGLPVEQTRSAA